MPKIKANSIGFALAGSIKLGEKLIFGGLATAAVGLLIIKKGQWWFVGRDQVTLNTVNDIRTSMIKHCRP